MLKRGFREGRRTPPKRHGTETARAGQGRAKERREKTYTMSRHVNHLERHRRSLTRLCEFPKKYQLAHRCSSGADVIAAACARTIVVRLATADDRGVRSPDCEGVDGDEEGAGE